jgi:hypothetical protein
LDPLPSGSGRLGQRITKGPGSRAAGVAMAFKLIESVQGRVTDEFDRHAESVTAQRT